jgi:hypothetical protein
VGNATETPTDSEQTTEPAIAFQIVLEGKVPQVNPESQSFGSHRSWLPQRLNTGGHPINDLSEKKALLQGLKPKILKAQHVGA